MTVMLLARAIVAGTVKAANLGWTGLRRRMAQRRTAQALSALDSRTLHDIGLHRIEIRSVVYGNGADRIRQLEG